MVRIRLRRVGARNQPSFRIVAADRESPRDGRFLEVLGSYNPRTEPSTIQIDEARLFHWMQHGAQPSDSVVQTLHGIGTWERWERFKAGEAMELLAEEAQAAIPEVDPRTRRDEFMGTPSKKKKRKSKETEPEVAPAKAGAKPEPPEEPMADDQAEAAEASMTEEPAEAPRAEEQADSEEPMADEEAEPMADEEAEPMADEEAEPAEAEMVEAENAEGAMADESPESAEATEAAGDES